ncbi:hypothetical protein CDD81_141 [Ophiocordyceps australis]|uniref:FAD/NAD(P)-binding domain-containing protein n=1 Tax=Ophiocordyceps australis TaxID=1399860 RepID=A0A2C5YIC0_9HYPO|nr:hypothetical protein CDD81_141 [Ophiocordyceps australis]
MGDQSSLENFKINLTDYSAPVRTPDGPYASDLDVDALIIGAGFGGVFMLKTLRDRGYKTVIYEAGDDIGGTWRWNCYPGAAVDSEVPEYEFSWPEVWKTWNWTTNYPGYKELRAYFDHVDKAVGIKKDCAFNTVVVGADFDTNQGKWNVRTKDGRTATTKFLILATGMASKRYVPSWPGMDKFKGTIHHSSFWPDYEVDVSSKKCAVIGTGASGVQITQAWGPKAQELKVLQRTPNLALPVRRRDLTVEEQEAGKKWYPHLFEYRERTFGGFIFDWLEKNTSDDTIEEQKATYEKAWETGGFRLWIGMYKDVLLDGAANKPIYDFWASKTRQRIQDARKRDILAPLEMPHYFGTKRPCLEFDYYEQFNRPSVDVVDLKNNPIKEFTETGITLEDGTHHEFDVVAVATGFDVVTGGMTQLGLESITGEKLDDEWKTGATTYLGLTVSGYPNMFHMYGTHAPTLLANGPSLVEIQGRWIVDCMDKMKHSNIKYIDAKPESAQAWKKLIVDVNNATLFPTTRSTYMGGNVQGKVQEPMCYANGVNKYAKEVRLALDSMEGFEMVQN